METEIQIRQSFVVNRSRKETYAFWRRVEEFPRFMRHLESVEPVDAKRSRWVVGGPAGRTMTWETEIVEEEPGNTVAWRTVGRSDVRHDGRVELDDATGNRGTVVSVRLTYRAAAHNGRSAFSKVFRHDRLFAESRWGRRPLDHLKVSEVRARVSRPCSCAPELR